METREAIEVLGDLLDTTREYPHLDGMTMFGDAIDLAISALEKQDAIKACTPPSDDWEHYADRLHDIAYKSGYEQGKKDAEE